MERSKAEAVIEAILFTMGDSVEISRLAEVIEEAAPAPKIGDSALDHLQTYLADIYTIPANLAGLPAMSIPCGTVKEGGMELPVGFQMTAPHFREDLLLKTGFALGK